MTDGAVAAVDLGASSGRVIVGRVADGRVSLEEVHRFPNEPVQLEDGLYWDALRLHHEILTGLRRAARVAPGLRSIGIDTWGVDVGMLDGTRALVGNPVHHRDPRNVAAVERVHARIPQAELYARTGLQFMSINTLYQLEAARVNAGVRGRAPRPAAARPARVLADRGHRRRAHPCVHDRPARPAGPAGGTRISSPGSGSTPPCCRPSRTPDGARTRAGQCSGGHRRAGGCVVTLVGSHDTASAVVGVPADLRGCRLHLVGHVVVGRDRDARRRSSPRQAGGRTSRTRVAWTGRTGSCAT